MKSANLLNIYLDGTFVYIKGSLWDGFANGMGGFTDGPCQIQNPETFFKNDFYSYGFNPKVGSVGMPVADTIRATMPQECWQIPVFKRLHSGFTEEVPNPYGKSINAYPIQSHKNVLIRLNFMEPQRILMIFV